MGFHVGKTMKINLVCLAVVVFLLSVKTASASPCSVLANGEFLCNISGQVSGGAGGDLPDNIGGSDISTPFGEISGAGLGQVFGGFDPTTGSFSFGLFDAGYLNEGDPGTTLTVMESEVNGSFSGTVTGVPVNGGEVFASGFGTVTGEFILEDLAGLEYIYTFTEPAFYSLDVSIPPGCQDENCVEMSGFVNFPESAPAPEPASFVLVLLGVGLILPLARRWSI